MSKAQEVGTMGRYFVGPFPHCPVLELMGDLLKIQCMWRKRQPQLK